MLAALSSSKKIMWERDLFSIWLFIGTMKEIVQVTVINKFLHALSQWRERLITKSHFKCSDRRSLLAIMSEISLSIQLPKLNPPRKARQDIVDKLRKRILHSLNHSKWSNLVSGEYSPIVKLLLLAQFASPKYQALGMCIVKRIWINSPGRSVKSTLACSFVYYILDRTIMGESEIQMTSLKWKR